MRRPQQKIEIVAGTPPGGGLERAARACANISRASARRCARCSECSA